MPPSSGSPPETLYAGAPIALESLLVLAELAHELTLASNLEMLQQILSRRLHWILDFDCCTLAVCAEVGDTHYLLFEISSPRSAKQILTQKIPLSHGWAGNVLLESKPYFVDDLEDLPPSILRPINAHLGISAHTRSMMLLPLRSGKRTMGSLNFSSSRGGAYFTKWRNLASLLASPVAGQLGAILNQMQCQRADALRQQVEQTMARVQVAEASKQVLEDQVEGYARQLRQTLDFEAMLKRIREQVRDNLDENQILQAVVQELTLVLDKKGCAIALCDQDLVSSRICYQYTHPNQQETSCSLLEIAQPVTLENFPEGYQQLTQNQSFQFCAIALPLIRSPVAILLCPIFDHQGLLGHLWVFSSQESVFETLEMELVQQVASQCAIAIRQAQLYQAAQAQEQELEKLNQLKDDFLSTISHELRTPVSNMKLAIQTLQIAPTPERLERYLKILQRECAREIELINNLLDLQRLEALSYPTFIDEAVNLEEWFPHFMEPFRADIQAKEQTLQVNFPTDLPVLVLSRTNLERVLTELLNNACKYTVVGGTICIKADYTSYTSVPASRLKPLLTFSVSNEAEIPATELPYIFEKFYRVPNENPWKQAGTGLGLALVKKLVDQFQGEIQVESQKGWTTFTLRMPVPDWGVRRKQEDCTPHNPPKNPIKTYNKTIDLDN
ncbi:MAG: GAF domain-containing protein [Leptolyngbyaceae bacterium]|nr:GAF domain-containing protein [Leptolyngbyaceae bacterium]